jgi:hypothetical protein
MVRELANHKKRQHPQVLPFKLKSMFNYHPQLPPPLPHDEHAEAGPKSMLELILNPYPRKSTVTGLAFSSNSLSMIN